MSVSECTWHAWGGRRTDAFAVGTTGRGKGACEEGFTCPWWTVEQDATGGSETEALKDLGVE